ncbi:hypothetical protein J3Q64DRAFT_1816784 [Phycomyces blakesleeanus]|uniref:Uncharacterized protein n=1 Tax=Phycomyces blakesleeanus TaxID=4837 RepID=A0ABR3BCJ2_PHYBL
MDTPDSVKTYWKHLQHGTRYITIGHARRCEEVFLSPICKADQPILETNSPKQDDLLKHLKGSHGDIPDLVARVYFSYRPSHLVIIDYTGFSTSPNDIRLLSFFFEKNLNVDMATLNDQRLIAKTSCLKV